ncbi:TonB-dependent receptor [Sphingomonas sp. S2-65]|uniref:TonB-dependent receptor n=1 Tax=Sphingomonas sp. S2-65 TaxID=2903960 RepID=UPI001F1B80BC|nr:TonB-dependent receptor [Sphingomonas sp. S2-65]UYY57151.1 TonB-dependent receptor [Sphingomonas sp. S2-65]
MTGVAMEASLACQVDVPSQSSPAANEPRTKPAEPSPPQTQFLDADGKPLPPDLQRDLREQFKEGLPPVKEPDAAPRMPSPTTTSPSSNGDVTITARQPRGSVIGDIPPERTFSSLDINAYGAGNIAELIQSLGPQVSSSRGGDGNPVTLLNGRRVSSFAEIAEIPAEAIERIEVFPEELALKYGYLANQKVVNIVTFERFSTQIGQISSALSTEGGYNAERVQSNYFSIRGDTRVDVSAQYNRAASLLESNRDLAQLGDITGAGKFRTLLPGIEQLTLNGIISGNLLNDISSTLGARIEANDSNSLLGLGSNGPLVRDTDTHTVHVGTTLGGRIGQWMWSFTGNYERTITDTVTDTNDGLGSRNEARSINSLANADLVLTGSVLKLPAGPVATSLRVGSDMRDFSSRSLQGELEQQADFSRKRGAMQASFDVPIASRREKELTWLGDLSANVNLAFEQLSDFRTLRTFGYGFNWSPTKEINIIASATNQESAPTVEQLGAPLIVTPNVRTFDFLRREVADTVRIFGGNPNLRSDDRHVVRLGVNARPFANADFTLSIDYLETHTDDPIAPFPIATPEIEAAYPDRFTRGVDGRLLRIDSTPLNFERSEQEQIRWGVSFVSALGAVEPWMRTAPVRTYSNEAEARAAAPVGTMVAMIQPGSAMARRFENLSSRLYLNFYHTLQLRDKIVVRDNLPALDLLDGSVTDIFGGTRRHRVEVQAGFFKKGLGGRLTTSWQSGSTVRNVGEDSGNLTFSGIATVNVNLFANIGERFGSKPSGWLKGSRIVLGINNLFNARPLVQDRSGLTPLSYQAAYLDPIGRFINVGVRKSF